MASQNINQYVRSNWSLKLNLDSNDMSLTSDEQDYNQEVVFSPYLIAQTYGNRLPVYFDINNPLSVQNQTLSYKQYNNNNIFVSQNYYNPNNDDLTCYSSSTSCDIGLTGVDNGLVNQMTGETITFTKGLYSDYLKFNRMYYDRRLKLHQVTGHTNLPNVRFSGFNKTVLYEVVSKSSPFEGRYHELYGGFYQGFYKLFGFDYEIFPERMNKGWSVEMVLKPRLINEYSPLPNETTLNEIYPNNKNTFFYFGTRAENKFYHHASGSPLCFSGYNRVTSGLTQLQTCACCNRTITDSRCVFVYPPRSVNNIHDPHVNYGCSSCNGDPEKKITCGCDCNLDPCETCGWECQTHICDTIIIPTPTPTPPPTPIPDCELPPVCTPSCDVCTTTTTCYNCNTGFTSIENTCETNPIYDSMSNALSFRLCGDPKNPGIGVRMLKFTGDCVTTGSCETSGITYTTGHTIVDYCTPPIYPTCLLENPAWLEEEHWFQVDAVWERYTWLDTCDLWYRGGLGDITEKLYLESLANNATSLITIPYTQIGGKTSEQIELVRLNEKWLIDKLYRNGRLKIYVNGKLFHTIENFEEIIPRGLDTDKEKQVGVPFNISWGGGTQGLRENLTFSSMTQPYGPYIQDPENFPINDLSGTTFNGLKTNILIEQNFAGTFDGAISQFRMYVTPLSAPEVKHNFNLLKNTFRMFNPDCPDCSTSVCLPNDFTYQISGETTTTTTTNLTTTTTTTSNLTTTTTTTYSPTTTTTTYSPTTTTTTYSPTTTTTTYSQTPTPTPTNTSTPTPTPTNTSTPTSTPTPTPTPTVYTPGECIRFIDDLTDCTGTIALPSNISPSTQINGKSSYYFTYYSIAPPTVLMRISWDNINNYWILEDMSTYYPLPNPLAYLPINSLTPIGGMNHWVPLPNIIGSCLYGGGAGIQHINFLTYTVIGDCSSCCKTFQLYSGFGPGTGSTYQILYCDNTVEVIDVPLYVTITYKCAINVIKLNGGGTVTVVDINCDCDPNNLSI
jgi:hypothetical protein